MLDAMDEALTAGVVTEDGVLHEAGHGLYDQGLREADHGTPLGSASATAGAVLEAPTLEALAGAEIKTAFAGDEATAVKDAIRNPFKAALVDNEIGLVPVTISVEAKTELPRSPKWLADSVTDS